MEILQRVVAILLGRGQSRRLLQAPNSVSSSARAYFTLDFSFFIFCSGRVIRPGMMRVGEAGGKGVTYGYLWLRACFGPFSLSSVSPP